MTFAERRRLELDYKEWLKRESIANGVAVEDCALTVIGYLDSKGLINKMPKWIPVSERLPKDNTYVAVINEYDEYEMAYFSSSKSAHPFSTDYADYKKDWVKVWMPIPEYEEGE